MCSCSNLSVGCSAGVLLLTVFGASCAPQLVKYLHVAIRFTSQSPADPGVMD